MKLDELVVPYGAKTSRRRVGRGIGSGLGKTSGKGHKGQNARAGGGVRRGFEGGQMPLYRRIPKRGFNNIFRTEYAVVNVADLNKFEDGTVVDTKILLNERLVTDLKDGVKVLAKGEITKKLTVIANKFSEAAKQKIEAAGGKIEVI